MFFKEWATDKSWLPKSGLDILMTDKQVRPDTIPGLIQPSFDANNIDKLDATLKKISAYLKEGAKAWWEAWISDAREGHGRQQQFTEQEESLFNFIIGVDITENATNNTRPECSNNNSISGVDVHSIAEESKVANIHDHEHEIPGIGHISTRWVGERGKEELLTEVKANKYKMELQELKAQATHLATECKKALMLVKHPGTAKAINLCNSFLMPAARQRKDKMNESLCLLWEDTAAEAENLDPATILGQDLVDTITEKNKQPPDIYLGNLRGKTAIRHNCNIDKDLEVGSLVAVNHPQWVGTVPQIGRVTKLPQADETIEMSWLECKRSKKPLLERTLIPSTHPQTTVHIHDILLYNFELNPKAHTLKKVTREELKRRYDELKSNEWSDVVVKRRRK